MVDPAWVKEHYNPVDPRLVGEGDTLGDGLWESVDVMLDKCPVPHTDQSFYGCPAGGWIVNRYDDVLQVLSDPETFSNQYQHGPEPEPEMIPIDLDPPLHKEFRRLLQPYFAVKTIQKFAPLAESVITRLIDDVVETGRIDDVMTQIAQPFSSEVQWGWLMGVDPVDHVKVLDWMRIWIHEHFEPSFEAMNKEWWDWMQETIDRRREEPRRDDLIDGLLHSEVEGRPLTDDEIVRVLMIMILGGVTTTTDTIASVMLRLAVTPGMQEELANNLEVMPRAVEEFLRIEPPATGISREVRKDVVVGDETLKAGDKLFYHISAANRDPRKFEDPHAVKFDRVRNPHFAFGGGIHRCIGASFARQNLRIVFEQIVTRLPELRLVEGDPPVRVAGIGWTMEKLPVQFTPGPKSGA